MQGHTIDDGCHGKFRHAGMQESSREVVGLERSAHLEETVGLVAVGKVGRRDDHVINLLGEGGEHVGAGSAGGDAGLVLNGGIVHLGSLAVNIVLQALHGLGILLCPCIDGAFALCDDFALFVGMLGIQFCYLGEYRPGILGVATQVRYRLAVIGTRLAQRVTVCAAFALKVLALGGHAAASHDGAADDDGGALGFGKCLVQGVGKGNRVGAVTLDDVPVPSAVFHGGVLVAHGIAVGRELHRVAVVEHDEVAQAQVAGNASGLLRDALLNAAVTDEGIGLVGKHLAIVCSDETLGNGTSHGHHVALSQGTRRVLHTVLNVQLGVAGSDAAPGAERLDVVGGIMAGEVQHAVEHG